MATNESNIRFRADWTSLTGIQYRVDMIDTEYVGPANNLELGPDGFDLSYEGKTDDILNRLIPSSVSLSILITDATVETIIADLALSAEDRFSIAIYKFDGSAYARWWAGVVVPDLSNWSDADYPFLYHLKAIDGLARIKEITYAPPSGSYSFINHLVAVLENLAIAGLWEASDTFFSTAANWFSAKMYSTTPPSTLDPLKASAVGVDTYTFLDDKKQRQYMKCYDVLNQILEQWNLRMFLAEGRFWLIQTNMLVGATNITVHSYDKLGGSTTNDIVTVNKSSGFNRKGSFKFLRPVSKVSVNNAYWMQFQYERLSTTTGPYTNAPIGLFSTGNSETVAISGSGSVVMSDTDTHIQKNRLHFKMKVQIGIYFLEESGGQYSWTTDSTAVIDIYTGIYNNFNYTTSIPLNLTTPVLKAMGIGKFSFNFFRYEDDGGNAIQLPTTVTCNISYNNFSIKQSMTDGNQPFYSESDYSGTLFEKKLADLLTGDGPSSDDKGKISVLNTSSAWEEARGDWTDGGSGTATWLNQLMANQVLALMALPLRKYHGTIERGNVAAYHTLSFGGKTYTLLSGTFQSNYDRWTGDFVELTEN